MRFPCNLRNVGDLRLDGLIADYNRSVGRDSLPERREDNFNGSNNVEARVQARANGLVSARTLNLGHDEGDEIIPHGAEPDKTDGGEAAPEAAAPAPAGSGEAAPTVAGNVPDGCAPPHGGPLQLTLPATRVSFASSSAPYGTDTGPFVSSIPPSTVQAGTKPLPALPMEHNLPAQAQTGTGTYAAQASADDPEMEHILLATEAAVQAMAQAPPPGEPTTSLPPAEDDGFVKVDRRSSRRPTKGKAPERYKQPGPAAATSTSTSNAYVALASSTDGGLSDAESVSSVNSSGHKRSTAARPPSAAPKAKNTATSTIHEADRMED